MGAQQIAAAALVSSGLLAFGTPQLCGLILVSNSPKNTYAHCHLMFPCS